MNREKLIKELQKNEHINYAYLGPAKKALIQAFLEKNAVLYKGVVTGNWHKMQHDNISDDFVYRIDPEYSEPTEKEFVTFDIDENLFTNCEGYKYLYTCEIIDLLDKRLRLEHFIYEGKNDNIIASIHHRLNYNVEKKSYNSKCYINEVEKTVYPKQVVYKVIK